MTERKGWVLLAFGLLAALFYAPLLLGLRTFPDGDFTHHFLPFSLFQHAEYLAGRLPVWNPNTYAGHPFLADIQAAVFYPLNNLVLLLTLPFDGAGARLYFLQVEAVLHVALAGFFTWLLVRELTGHANAALLSGCAFAFSGYVTGYPPLQLAVLRTAIWLPLLLWMVWRATRLTVRNQQFTLNSSALLWWTGAGVVYAAAFLAGHPQTFLLLSYGVGAWVLFLGPYKGGEDSGEEQDSEGVRESSSKRTSRRRRLSAAWRMVGGVILMFAVALGLSAAQLWPSVEFMRLSVRANVDYEFVSGGFPLSDTWQVLMPGVLTTFSPLYIGVVGLGLAFVTAATLTIGSLALRSDRGVATAEAGSGGKTRGARKLPRSTGACAKFFGGMALVALLLSYGDNGFLYPLFYRFTPGWNLFRGQERAAYLVAFGLSVLAGYGMALLPQLRMRWRRLIGLGFATLVTFGVYSFGLFWQLKGVTAVSEWRFLGIAFVTLTLAGVFWGILWRPGWSTRRDAALFGLAVATLFWANATTNLAPFGPVRKTILSPELEALQGAVADQGADSVGLLSRVYNEFRVYEDYGMRLGIEDTWGSSPLRLARYALLHDQFPLDRLWALTGAQHVLTWRRELFVESTLLGEYPQTVDTTYLHRLLTPNPRAWIVHEAEVVDDATALALLADHSFDLRKTALLAPEAGAMTEFIKEHFSKRIVGTGTNEVTLTRMTPTHYEITVDAEQTGWLIITENWMPGWQVVFSNDYCPPQITCPSPSLFEDRIAAMQPRRANLTSIGIFVPAGQSHFSLMYQPRSIRDGLVISGVTLLLVTVITIIGWWRTRTQRAAS